MPITALPHLSTDDTLAPLDEMTTPDKIVSAMMDNSLPEIIREIGYAFTSSVEDCKNYLVNFSTRELTAVEVARIISTMMKYKISPQEGPQIQTPGNFWMNHEKKDSIEHVQAETWKAEIFVQALKILIPNLNWKEVILQLDHPDFFVPDRQSLNLLFTILRLGLQSSGYPLTLFPVEYLYRRWTNLEGQMSLINGILKHPEIFCFSDYPFHPVAIDILKAQPEIDNKEISTWHNLYLIELLLYAAERGYYGQVHELFKFPLQHCPDILLLALLQTSSPMNVFRQELLTNLIPVFLGNHPNSGTILHHAWHILNPNIKPIIMHAMADWYMRGECDQSRLSRILDVAQDLKALSLLLNVQSFPFVIDLACLASRREYLKLDKWLTDKIRDHGEAFVQAMVKFLQRRCLQAYEKGGDVQPPKATQLPHETIATILTCLQLCVPNVQPELQEAIFSVVAGCQRFILGKPRQMASVGQPQAKALEAPFTPASGLGGQLFPPHVDSITSLTSNVAGMSLGAATNTFAMPSAYSPFVPTNSPSRLMGAVPNNTFTILPFQHNTNVPNIAGLPRLPPTPMREKPRIPDLLSFPDATTSVSKEIEDEANSYFQCIYNHPPHPTLSIEEVLDMLKNFHDSPIKRERDVYSCMLRNLFEEYKFFPQYPDKELNITAQLFGGIIEKGLVPSYVSLGLALRFVLDALRNPEGSKMYCFGITALDKFKSRLKDYHKYCEHVRAIPHFPAFPPHLIEYVEYGLRSQEPPTKPQGSVLSSGMPTGFNSNSSVASSSRAVVCAPSTSSSIPSTVSTMGTKSSRPSIANVTNIDTLLAAKNEKIIIPPESIQDKTSFIFNNLSQLNLQKKSEELKEIIAEEYYPWLSQYLVLRRVSIEPNFQIIYSNFLDCLNIPILNKIVLKETYRNIKVLLRTEKELADFSDRKLLRDLGYWLGMITLKKDIPILHTDLDLKALLLEAYLRGQETLLYVVPFVGKVLNSCIHSDVFKPPNPWTMALISVFIELHQEPDLKINLKFEVEILCKNLNLKIADLKPAFYLKNPDKVRQIEVYLLSPVKANKEAVAEAANAPIAHAKQVQMTTPQARIPIEEQAVETVTPTSGLIASDLNMMDIIGEPRLNCPDANLALNPPIVPKPYFNPSTLLLQNYPHLKQLVKPAIERSIQEWLHPAIERSLKYTLIACEHIVRKDFALHPDEMRMRSCAHHMAGGLISNVAMITCRQNVFNAISDNLKSAFLAAILPKTQQQRDLAVSAADVLAAENMEVACGFIQKAAVEKGLYELDKRLLSDYEIRKMARQEGKQYYDPAVLSYHMERMVERLRTCLGGPTDQRMAFVYDNQPCGASGPLQDMHAIMPKEVVQEQTTPMFYNELFGAHQVQATDAVAALINEAEMFVSNAIGTASLAGLAANMHSLLECLSMSQRCKDNVAFGITLLQKAIEGLLELHTLHNEHVELFNRYRDIHLRLLKMLEDTRVFGHVWTTKQITHCLTECREEIRYNLEAVDCLIRSNLVNMPQYDVAIAKLVDVGNLRAVNFAMQLVQLYLVDDLNNMYVNETDLYHTTESLTRMLNHSRLLHPEGLGVLIETVRVNQNPSAYLGERSLYGPTAFIHSGIMIARAGNHDDPPGLREKTEILLREWCNYLHKQGLEIEIFHSFIVYLHRKNMQDILKNEDLLTRFLRIATQLCIENVYQLVNEDIANPQMPSKRERYYAMVDPFVKLVSYIIRNNANGGNPTPKLNLLNKFLGIIAGFLIQDQEDLKTQFHQLPYHRLMLILFLDMNVIADPVLEAMNYQVLTAFCHTLRIVRPSVAPGFCYAWLEVVAHRSFINRMLVVTPQQKGWGMYATLLIEQLKYLNPFLRNLKLAPPVVALYKGTMKLFLVLLHDFPEFLCDYHFAFCDEIPANCIQMRNLILSAFPRNMRLPDPMAPNLKVDLLVETTLPPRAVINNATILPPSQFKKDLDAYLEARAPVTFLSELRSNMQVQNTPGQQYNAKLINAVVLHVGIQAIAHIRAKGQIPSISTIAHSAHMDIFQNFTVDFDYEGRYLFLNSVANHLRYPNSHTHYFSCVILYLFAEAHSEAVQEQISRMLFERLIVNRPHPWGLLVTFIELIKNPTYKFWTHEFLKYAPEIEKKFSHLIDKARENNSSARN